ncbi:NAD(P)/FAD-dependent oxidoreductase [Ornithinimicrobium faecis]|uniref:NAD(P)/FAD-dependent oxidoreductase n=1 Tax=Ornithinimicrobium faecis TaxID=2934158 RepID=UPI0021179CB1|nr:NAD(P)/FAD-dependent oxidoreductase [Ornithinimicrobium sp. HY1745]
MQDTSAADEIQDVLTGLGEALAARDVDRALTFFAEDCYWRDFVSFTWNMITLEGQDAIADMLRERLADVQPDDWAPDDTVPARQDGAVTEGFIRFSTSVAHGYGYLRLRDGKIWTLLTTAQDLKGHEEPGSLSRPLGLVQDEQIGEPTWTDRRDAERAELGVTQQPYVLIVGGGHSGIILAARLRQLGVPALIVEKNERAGDNWRKRYKTLQLHNPIWENELPYLSFPDNWPIYMNKDKFADWLESYTNVMELNFWGGAEATSARFDEETSTWEVEVERHGEKVTLRPKQLVMSTGSHARPTIPDLPGRDVFEGIQQHSSEHPGPDGLEGKKVVVVGSGTSAHDIAAALAARDVDVTMIQRSPTYVVKPDSFNKHVLGALYSQEAAANGVTPEKGDILAASFPYALFFDVQKAGVDKIREIDAEFYEELGNSGFLLDFGPRDGGLFARAITGVNNYYIDVGAAQMIIDGRLKVASGSGVKELRERSLILEDGRELDADAIIYATGFTSMKGAIADLISPEVAERLGEISGIGSGEGTDPGPWEGEIRNMWKPVDQEGLWFHGALIAHARSYSRYLALQLKARMEGMPTPTYRLEEARDSSLV